jgi:DNA repair protein RecO (recombination protein O)
MSASTRQRLYRTEAIVLRRQDFGEADKLLTLYTPGLGKTRVLAKGVRKPRSRKGGHVELFIHCNLLIAKGKSLDIVTQAETIHSFLPIRSELERTSYAYFTAELLDRFTAEGEENRPLFDLLLDTLSRLANSEDPDLALRFFELRLLGYAGYRPQLFQCVRCARAMETATGVFSPTDGGLLCLRCGEGERGCQEVSPGAVAALRYLQSKDYALCRRLRLDQRTREELENLMRRYVTFLLERGLKSADFIDALRREKATPAPALIQEGQVPGPAAMAKGGRAD